MTYATIISLCATIQNPFKEINMNNDFTVWANSIKSSEHAYLLSNSEMAEKINKAAQYGGGYMYSGECFSGIEGLAQKKHFTREWDTYQPNNLPVIQAAEIGTEIKNTYSLSAGHGIEIFTKLDSDSWAMTYSGHDSRHNQESDCWYDPFQGWQYRTNERMNNDDDGDTYSFLEEQASKPRGSQKYRAQ